MIHSIGQQEERLAEREQAISDARALLRAEREQFAADKAETDRLLAEARAAHKEAKRDRERARRLGARLVRHLKHRNAETRRELDHREAKIASEQERLNRDLAKFFDLRSEFHATAASTRDRIREAWAVVESQQKRATEEWAEAERYFAEQTTQLDERAAELTRRERAFSDKHARNEGDTVGLREEATALEARVEHARAALAELESQRDRIRAELLNTESLPDLIALSPSEPGDLATREAALAREKAAVNALRESLEHESADIGDRKRVLAEQFTLLSHARAKWQRIEQQTMLEMEQMARELDHREGDIEAREQRVIRADRRRRDDAYDLWQMRMRLEAWQTKLTALEARSQTEREQAESDLERRTIALNRREVHIEELFTRWTKSRQTERDRLAAELAHWARERERLMEAAGEFTFQRQFQEAQLSTCAARAMAAEELVASAIQDSGSDRMKRRMAVMQRRWEQLFDRKVREIELRRADLATELTALHERYRQLHRLMAGVLEREAKLNNAASAAELHQAMTAPVPLSVSVVHPDTTATEMATLRDEVERLAGLFINLEPPASVEPFENQLPWGTEVPQTPANPFQFDTARAA